jgi:hypothetical protein
MLKELVLVGLWIVAMGVAIQQQSAFQVISATASLLAVLFDLKQKLVEKNG